MQIMVLVKIGLEGAFDPQELLDLGMEDAGDRTWSCWIQALSLHEDLLRAADLVGRLRSRLPESSSLEAAEATVIVEFDDFEGVVVVGRTIGPDALRAMSEVGLDLGISVENPSI